uniref:2-octaprenylphenol hydroxylase ) n=1 Tax=Ganoderma boninense TaxID=34458 RepID=A0A5K1K151_9APHY|nr:2-octaprenylphenol hydroxylase (EC (2-polyprenylphenol 6-hydroxylase) [Ganoderma boninense]
MEASRAYVPPSLSSPTPSVLPLRPLSAQSTMQPLARTSLKSRLSVNPKELPPAPMSFTYEPPAIADVSVSTLASDPHQEHEHPHLFSFPPVAASTPLKRRREAMSTSADGPPTSDGAAASGAVGTSRRRTRSWRGDQAKQQQQQHQQRVDGAEAMDVEEEGPQRKRVARR